MAVRPSKSALYFPEKTRPAPEEPVKKTVYQWTNATQWHGVKDAADAGWSLLFLFWIVVIAAMLVICFWQSYMGIATFITENAYTTNVYYTTASTGLDFPNITICNYNRARNSTMQALGLTQNALTYFFWSYYVAYPYSLSWTQSIGGTPPIEALDIFYQGYSDWCLFLTKHPEYVNKTDQLAKDLSHTCNETIISCSFGAKSITAEECCNSSTVVSNSYGSCFSLSFSAAVIPQGSNQALPGPSMGMRLIMDPLLTQYSGVVWNNFLDEGIVVLANYEPKHPFPENPVHVPPGSHALIALSQKRYTFSPPAIQVFTPPCDYGRTLTIVDAQYTVDTCNVDCYVTYTAQLCNCTMLGVEAKNSSSALPSCMPEQSECVWMLMNYAAQWNNSMPSDPPNSMGSSGPIWSAAGPSGAIANVLSQLNNSISGMSASASSTAEPAASASGQSSTLAATQQESAGNAAMGSPGRRRRNAPGLSTPAGPMTPFVFINFNTTAPQTASSAAAIQTGGTGGVAPNGTISASAPLSSTQASPPGGSSTAAPVPLSIPANAVPTTAEPTDPKSGNAVASQTVNSNCGGTSNVLPSTLQKVGALYQTCVTNCIDSCEDKKQIDTSVSTTTYPASSVQVALASSMRMIQSNAPTSNIAHTIIVDIFYPSLGYETMLTQETMPVFTLIGNLGGQLALWLGASVVTIIHMLYYMCLCQARCCRRVKRRWTQAEERQAYKTSLHTHPTQAYTASLHTHSMQAP